MSEASRTLLLAALSLAAGFTGRAAHGGDPGPSARSPRRRAAPRAGRGAALAACAAAYLGFAATHEHVPGAGLDVALALGFGLVAASTIVRDPRQALTIVALAFAAHAVLDVAHRLASCRGVVPARYSVGCAVFNVHIGASRTGRCSALNAFLAL